MDDILGLRYLFSHASLHLLRRFSSFPFSNQFRKHFDIPLSIAIKSPSDLIMAPNQINWTSCTQPELFNHCRERLLLSDAEQMPKKAKMLAMLSAYEAGLYNEESRDKILNILERLWNAANKSDLIAAVSVFQVQRPEQKRTSFLRLSRISKDSWRSPVEERPQLRLLIH